MQVWQVDSTVSKDVRGIVLKDKELRMDDIMFGLTEKIFGVDYYIVKTSIYRELKGLARQIGTYLELPQGMIYLN